MYSATFGGRAGRSKKSGPSSKKPKCLLCGAKGHEADACPRKDDFKSLSSTSLAPSGGAGSGITHKTSRKANNSNNKTKKTEGVEDETTILSDLTTTTPLVLFDAGCDVGASIDNLALLLKSSEKKCTSTYNAAISSPNYGGAICRQYIKAIKPWKKNSPRVTTMLEADPNLFFLIGLGSGFLECDEEEDYAFAVDALTAAKDEDDLVVGFCAKLDYGKTNLSDVTTQLARLKATCRAAIQEKVPIQIRVVQEDGDNNDATKDLAKVLLDMSDEEFHVHLSCWNGSSTTMLQLLQAFPNTLYIGMNAAVGFAKAATARECAFDVPLDRLLLETDNLIPSPVTKSLGRKAFSHSGLLSYCAAAVAEQKRISPVDVAKAASDNTIRLFGKRIAERAKEVLLELELRLEQQKELEKQQEEAIRIADKEIEAADAPLTKKKKKKKGGAEALSNLKDEADFDDEILLSMLVVDSTI